MLQKRFQPLEPGSRARRGSSEKNSVYSVICVYFKPDRDTAIGVLKPLLKKKNRPPDNIWSITDLPDPGRYTSKNIVPLF